MDNCFLYRVARCRSLTGNDLRIINACYTNAYSQKELVENMSWKKSNVNRVVKKLFDLGILKKVLKDDYIAYIANRDWVDINLENCEEIRGE